eukprot:TRINITY_DN11417_c0_g1_i1.p1 TRINITY_DN11417_c0_g1~~TRINITY_DN11417_c0_g1_i1.p1  ORF type:complete len:353 (+),score=28.38 TRINITY_DN11417_c0_g1_i1:338-1396(+)
MRFKGLFSISARDGATVQSWLEANPEHQVSAAWSNSNIDMDADSCPFPIKAVTFGPSDDAEALEKCAQSLQWPAEWIYVYHLSSHYRFRDMPIDQVPADQVEMLDISPIVAAHSIVNTDAPVIIKTDRLRTLRLGMDWSIPLQLEFSTIDTRCEHLALGCLQPAADMKIWVPKQQALIERTQCSILEIELSALALLTSPLPWVRVVTLRLRSTRLATDKVIQALRTARDRFPNACSIQPQDWSVGKDRIKLFRYYSAGSPAEAIGRSMTLLTRHHDSGVKSDIACLYKDLAIDVQTRVRERLAVLKELGDLAMATWIHGHESCLTELNIPDTVWSALFRAMYLIGYAEHSAR